MEYRRGDETPKPRRVRIPSPDEDWELVFKAAERTPSKSLPTVIGHSLMDSTGRHSRPRKKCITGRSCSSTQTTFFSQSYHKCIATESRTPSSINRHRLAPPREWQHSRRVRKRERER
jgi:hypothetical protein